MTTRRSVLMGAGLMLSLGASGRAFAQVARPIRFGLTPVFLTSDLELLAALRSYLSRAWQEDVQLVMRRTYQEITLLLVSGQIDAAWICGYPYVQYRDRLDLLAVPVWRSQLLYQSYVIVESLREITAFEQTAGDVHAFSDPDSNSGYLVTRALLAERNLHPEQFYRRTFFTYGHRNVVRAVASGLAQSGSVDGYIWEVLREVEPELTSRTRVLRRSEWLGFPPIASGKVRASGMSKAQLASAFLNMADDPDGHRVLAALRLEGFAAADPSLFDPIAAKIEQVQRLGS